MLGRLKGAVKKALGRDSHPPAPTPFVTRSPSEPDRATRAAAAVIAPPVVAPPVVARPVAALVVAPPVVAVPVVAVPVVAVPVAPPVSVPVVAVPVVAVPVAPPVVARPVAPPVAEPPNPVDRAAAAAHAEAAATTEAVHAGEPPPVKALSMAERAMAVSQGRVATHIVHADMGSTDLEHYRARAIANGRDPGSITGGEGENTAEDGKSFWGPVDNESSRAKSGGQVLTVDQWECISCGTCVEQTDKVFFLPADGKATPIAQDGPMDLIQDAIEACPVTCIHWVSPKEAIDKGLATGMEDAAE